MNKVKFLSLVLLFVPLTLQAQDKFKGGFINEEFKINLRLNLYDDDIPVPGFELDSCYGYLRGGINGAWIILKVVALDDDEAEVRAVSERGSDAQNLRISVADDGKLFVRQIDGTSIKGVKGRKYVKLPKEIEFKR